MKGADIEYQIYFSLYQVRLIKQEESKVMCYYLEFENVLNNHMKLL